MYNAPLTKLRRLVRAEIGASLNPQQGVAAQDTLDIIIDRQQTELWEAYTWKHLRIWRPVTLAAGQSTYDYPADLPFEQVAKVYYADSPSARWRELLYGITLTMMPASGPPLGSPIYWDNVEAGSGPPIDGNGDGGGDGNGGTNTAPTITSDGGGPTATVTVAQSASQVTIVRAFDPDAGQILTYSIVGGTHASMFTINATTGVLSFAGNLRTGAGTFAVPGTYDVVVQVDDGHGGTDTQDITVRVVTGFPLTRARSALAAPVPTLMDAGHAVNPVGQFMLLPMPSSSQMLLKIEGQGPIVPLVNGTDRCALDDHLITLFAAAEILISQKSDDGPAKLEKARQHLRKLLANQTAVKRVNYNMGGRFRFGNDPDKQRYSVPYIDYIPS